MASAIGVRDGYDAGALRAAAKRSKDGSQARRLLALAAIYDGATRTEAAKIGGVGLQVVRDWVLKFNAQGPDGLVDRKAALAAILESVRIDCQRRRRAQIAELLRIVGEGQPAQPSTFSGAKKSQLTKRRHHGRR